MTKYLIPDEIIRKKQQYLLPCVQHFYQRPPNLVRGEMQYLYDHTGKRYLDCFAGVSVVNCGHCHAAITKAICHQAQTLQHTTTIYLTENIVLLAERLAQITPGRLQKTFFGNSGSEANEGAALLACLYTGQRRFISLAQSLHGRTKLAMSLTGLNFWRTDPAPLPDVSFVPNPYCYRCPLGKQLPTCDFACANIVEDLIQVTGTEQFAAMIVEPIQGNGGIITPPDGYFARLTEILRHYGILLIADEIQTGFGRTGKMFAIEHFDVEPDIMTMAKGLANGVPVGAFTARPEIADSYSRPGSSTFGGNPVTAAAALATLTVLEQEHLPAKAAILGQHLKAGLKTLQQEFPLIGDVRGLGLMLGVELVQPDKTPAAAATDIILEKMKDRGFLIGKNGPNRNVLAFQPPLVITRNDIDNLLNTLADVFAAVSRSFD